jgi:exopolysaccharide biosynthesis predicted pyruvyltransferase EpsI
MMMIYYTNKQSSKKTRDNYNSHLGVQIMTLRTTDKGGGGRWIAAFTTEFREDRVTQKSELCFFFHF